MAGFGSPVVPEVNINISISISLTPARIESGGLSPLCVEMKWLETHSVQQVFGNPGGVESSTRQIERSPVRESFIPSTLAAISLSKMNNLASAAVMQWSNEFDIKLKLMSAGTAPMDNKPNQRNINSGLLVKSIATWS